MNQNSILLKTNNKLILANVISYFSLITFLAFTKTRLQMINASQLELIFNVVIAIFGVIISYLNIHALTDLDKKTYLKLNIGFSLLTIIFFVSEIISRSNPNFISTLVIPIITFIAILTLLVLYFKNFNKYIKDDLTGKFNTSKLFRLENDDKKIILIISIFSSVLAVISIPSLSERYNLIGFTALLLLAIFTFFKTLLYFDIRSKFKYGVYYLILIELVSILILTQVASNLKSLI